MPARKLGRGLDSLIPPAEETLTADRSVALGQIRANPAQPRKHFDADSLAELAASIKEHGIIQPLIVTEADDGYELIAGERRLQAAHLVGLGEVPIVVRDAGDQEKLEVALIENVQRRDLSPLEEARAYRRLIDEFGLSQDDVADKVGKNRVTVSNTIRLLQLPPEIQEGLDQGKISEGSARAILGAKPEEQVALYHRSLRDNLTVRDVERAAKLSREGSEPAPRAALERLPRIETAIRERLGSRVSVTTRGDKGQIKVDFYSEEELERILGILGVRAD